MHTPEPMTGTVLLIDSEDRLPKQRAIFEKAGFTVVSAATTEEGLALARERHPDIVVSEVMLEKPDAGFVLGYRMKQEAKLANTPLVLLSGIFRQMGIAFDLNCPTSRQWINADLYLDRPVDPERLVAKVWGVLQHHRGVLH